MTEIMMIVGQIAATVLAWEGLKRMAFALREWHQDRKARQMGINWAGMDSPIWDAKHPEPLGMEDVLGMSEVPSWLRRQAD